MIDIILSAILSGVLKQGMPKNTVQIINKQEVYNVTTISTIPEDIKKEVHTPKVVAPEPEPVAPVAMVAPAPKPAPPPDKDYVTFNANDMQINLALKEAGNCSEPRKLMYAVWRETNLYYGCWVKINGQAHVMYDTGEAQIYKVEQ